MKDVLYGCINACKDTFIYQPSLNASWELMLI